MPYIEIAVPLDISTSEPLVTARTLPAEERPLSYFLQTKSGEHWFNLNRTTGELTLHKAQQSIATHAGTRVIKIHSASPLRPKVKFGLGSLLSYMCNMTPEFFISISLMACVFLSTTAILSIRSHSLLCSAYAMVLSVPRPPIHRSIDQSVSSLYFVQRSAHSSGLQSPSIN